MRSILFYTVACSLSIAASLAASSAPQRDIPGQYVGHAAHRQHQRRAERHAHEGRHQPFATAPAEVNYHYNVQRTVPGTTYTTSSNTINTIWQASTPVALAPAPVYSVVQTTQVAPSFPVAVYEQPTVVVGYQPAVRTVAALTPARIESNCKYMMLSDGSRWRIRHRDRPHVRHWRSGDAIGIEMGSTSRRFQYRLINHTRRTAADANRA